MTQRVAHLAGIDCDTVALKTPNAEQLRDPNLTDGIARVRFRDSLKQETLMEPAQVYPMTIKFCPTANAFKKGHRIRVDISNSNFPRFDVTLIPANHSTTAAS